MYEYVIFFTANFLFVQLLKNNLKYNSWQKLSFLIRQAIRIIERPQRYPRLDHQELKIRTSHDFYGTLISFWNGNIPFAEFKYQFAVLKMRPQHESSALGTKTSQYPNDPNRFFVRRNGQHALSPLLCPKGMIVFFFIEALLPTWAQKEREEREESRSVGKTK